MLGGPKCKNAWVDESRALHDPWPNVNLARFKRNRGGRTNAIEGVLQVRGARKADRRIVVAAMPASVAKARHSRTFPFLSMELSRFNGAD